MLKQIRTLILFVVFMITIMLSVNLFVVKSTSGQILTDFAETEEADYILVLGASVYNGKPRAVLEDRLNKAIELYNEKTAKKVLMSGDGEDKYYDEVSVMRDYAIENGVDAEDIETDSEGYSTYDSVVRAKKVFNAEKIIIVSQKFHLYRALYIANDIGLTAYGASADAQNYSDQIYLDLREIFARNKDFVKAAMF